MTSPAPPPRIAYLTSHYPAVSHTFILREVLALRELGLDVRTYAIRDPDPGHLLGPDERSAAADTWYIQRNARRLWPLLAAQRRLFRRPGRYLRVLGLAWKTRSPGLKAWLYQLFYFIEATLLAQKLEDEGVTHLHSHFAHASTSVAMLTAALADMPYSFTLHGPSDLMNTDRWHLAEKVARAAFVACISQFARSQVMLVSDPAHWDRLAIVHCGITPALYDHPPAAPHPGLRLIFVGRLSPVKGLRVLLAAMAQARKAVPDLHLTVVGDGPDRRHLEALAQPLEGAVTFTGYRAQSEVAQHLAEADAMILPSFAEGVPVVLMEAMASARPVICTQVAGVGELVEHGVSGLIVPPGDAATLAEAITTLAQNPDKRRKMGLAGRRTVLADFDIRQEAAKLAAMFETDPQSETVPQVAAKLMQKDAPA